MMKQILFLVFGIFLIGFVSAVPQVVFSNVSVTINVTGSNMTYHIFGEGVDATETIVLNVTNVTSTSDLLDYTRTAIPIQFSRDVCGNLDTAVLINGLAKNNNITQLWQNCIMDFAKCNATSDLALQYPQVKTSYDSCSNALISKQTELDNINSQRTLLIIAAAGGALLAWYFWRQVTPKTVATPGLSGLPRSTRM